MSLTKLLGSKRLDRHAATANEISELRKLVQRDLKDAGVSGLSADRIFATAYNAAPQLSKMALACAGYRVSSSMVGHHQITLDAARFLLGSEAQKLTDYFETCLRKRHMPRLPRKRRPKNSWKRSENTKPSWNIGLPRANLSTSHDIARHCDRRHALCGATSARCGNVEYTF